jgi:hypothetical protein
MTDEADAPTYSVLERLDLALAQRLTQRADRLDLQNAAEQGVDLLGLPRGKDAEWISGVLALRGIRVEARDALDVLNARSRHFMPDHQEHSLIVGLKGVLNLIRERGSRGVPPDGWCLVDLFRVLTRDIARFRGNDLRRDQPWDAILYVRYPPADDVRTLLDTFHPDHCFRDLPQAFERLHPVRKAFRILWRFARIAPFPDFNLVMAFVAMNSSLLANGYPPVFPEPGDREVLTHLVTGPVPQRITGFEARLLQVVEKT